MFPVLLCIVTSWRLNADNSLCGCFLKVFSVSHWILPLCLCSPAELISYIIVNIWRARERTFSAGFVLQVGETVTGFESISCMCNWPLTFWTGLDCFLSSISVVIKNLISTIPVWQRERDRQRERERKFLSFSVKHWSTIHLFLGNEWLILKGYQLDIIGHFWR